MVKGIVVVAVAVVLAFTAWLVLAPPVPSPTALARLATGPDRTGEPSGGSAERSPARTRSPRGLSVDEALKELDLIRPSRVKAAENFTAPMLGGSNFRLSDHRGKLVFVNFWATWCPPCREEMPAMERLWREHKDHGLVMVAVSLDTDPRVVAPFVKEHDLTFSIALDPTFDVANAYGVRALPSTFLVEGDGTLKALALGPRPWDNNASHALVEGLTER